jgi:thiamine monophosphate synthase
MKADRFELIIVYTCTEDSVQKKSYLPVFTGGTEIIHIRPGDTSLLRFKAFLNDLPSSLFPRIVIHGYYALASELGLRGIHLTELSRANSQWKQEIGSAFQGSISASFHRMTDLKENCLPYDYAFLSPVFPSISKPGYIPVFDMQELALFLHDLKENPLATSKVFALGGIQHSTLLHAKELGFQGAAVNGALWEQKDPLKEMEQLRNQLAGVDP